MKAMQQFKAIQTLIMGAIVLCVTLTLALSVSAQEVSDQDITSAINTEMFTDSATLANEIDVTTKNGIVTLEGTVESVLAKDRAQAIAAAIVGVRAIVNLIEVEPAIPRDDNELKQAAEQALLADPATYAYKVLVKAEDGIVTLSGSVNSYAKKRLSATVAKGVRGVKGINNEIDVDYKTTRSDREIQTEIEARLQNDIRVSDYLIDIKVNDGVVTLSGVVGSLQEKIRAQDNAWVAGVTSVESEALEIEWWARDRMRKKGAYVSRTDEEIKKAVEDAFLYDPRVLSFEPLVSVSNGTVTLSGTVDNLPAKRAAEQTAKNTLGVWRVKNHLKARPELPDDDELKNRVITALFNNPYVDRYDITVAARKGWVYLSGSVNTSFEKNQAERVAELVNGVVGVVNNIEHDYQWTWKADWEIRENVRDQLVWSPFVDHYEINVSVDDGIVTLRGRVNSWTEYEEAEKNAFQGGAKDVVNDLTVTDRYYGPYGPGYYGSPHYRGPGYYGPEYEPYM